MNIADVSSVLTLYCLLVHVTMGIFSKVERGLIPLRRQS